MYAGTLKFYDEVRGYGFITPDAVGDDVFVHATVFKRSALVPAKGMRLIYETGRSRDGRPRAETVQALEAESY